VAYDLAHDLTSATPTLADRILTALTAAARPLDDEVLARRAHATSRQAVTLVCRTLEASGRIRRVDGPDGEPVNSIATRPEAVATPAPSRPGAAVSPARITPEALLTENQVKRAVRDHLIAQGYRVHVGWGHTRRGDILADRDDERLLVEAKGQVLRRPQQADSFLGALGELIQRMTDPHATYGLALPDHAQYRGLVQRLPHLVWDRLNLVVYFVSGSGDALTVREVRRPAQSPLF
jgi:hypothetical protein